MAGIQKIAQGLWHLFHWSRADIPYLDGRGVRACSRRWHCNVMFENYLAFVASPQWIFKWCQMCRIKLAFSLRIQMPSSTGYEQTLSLQVDRVNKDVIKRAIWYWKVDHNPYVTFKKSSSLTCHWSKHCMQEQYLYCSTKFLALDLPYSCCAKIVA
jgi:hypothetical protein